MSTLVKVGSLQFSAKQYRTVGNYIQITEPSLLHSFWILDLYPKGPNPLGAESSLKWMECGPVQSTGTWNLKAERPPNAIFSSLNKWETKIKRRKVTCPRPQIVGDSTESTILVSNSRPVFSPLHHNS